MCKWIIFYEFNGKKSYDIIESGNTMSAKDAMLEKHNKNCINILDIDAYVPGMVELTEEEIADYRSRVVSLI